MRVPALLFALLGLSAGVQAQSPLDFVFPDGFERLQALRVETLELRDPHLFASVPIFGCQDLIATVNAMIAATLTADDDNDGILDNSLTLLFRPLHGDGRSGLGRFGNAACTVPSASTTCEAGDLPFLPLPYDSLAIGTCLAPIAGTTRPYSPPVASAVGPCFAAQALDFEFDTGLPLPLSDVRIGATRRESPTPGLSNGLLYGFLTETAADAITIELPLLGPATLSSLLPGGGGNCAAHSDKDEHEGVPGWWFYFNFSASEVPFAEQ